MYGIVSCVTVIDRTSPVVNDQIIIQCFVMFDPYPIVRDCMPARKTSPVSGRKIKTDDRRERSTRSDDIYLGEMSTSSSVSTPFTLQPIDCAAVTRVASCTDRRRKKKTIPI